MKAESLTGGDFLRPLIFIISHYGIKTDSIW